MAFDILVGNTEIRELLDLKDIRAMRALIPGGGGSFAFKAMTSPDFNLKSVPSVNQRVRFIFRPSAANGGAGVTRTIFGGVVTAVNLSWANPHGVEIHFECQDYMRWLDRKLVTGVFVNDNAGDMIKAILDTTSPDIGQSFIETGLPIFPKVFDFIRPSEAINQIAEDTGYLWWIDEDKNLHFTSTLANVAPIPALVPETNANVGDLRISIDSSRLANRIIIREFVFRSPGSFYENGGTSANAVDYTYDTDHFTPMGTKDRIYLALEPFSAEDVTVIRTSDIPDTSLAVLPDTVSNPDAQPGGSGTSPADTVYVNSRAKYIRWPQDQLPSNNDTYSVSYKPRIKNSVAEITPDILSILTQANRENSTDGIYDEIVSLQDIEITGPTNTDVLHAVQLLGNRILNTRAWPIVSGSFSVYSDKVDGWEIGQTFTIMSETFGVYDYEHAAHTGDVTTGAEGDHVPLRVWITRITTRPVNEDVLNYEIEFSNVPKIISG